MDRLNGKVAIVTGAGKKGEVDGTGYATSMLFAREGAKVLLADISPENANATLAEIEAEGGEAAIFIGDVSTEDACAGMVAAAVENFGKVNVLFNNVGLGGGGTVTQVDEAKWDRVMDVNLKSMIMTCKHAVPRMAGGGRRLHYQRLVHRCVACGFLSKPAVCGSEGWDDLGDDRDGGASRTR